MAHLLCMPQHTCACDTEMTRYMGTNVPAIEITFFFSSSSFHTNTDAERLPPLIINRLHFIGAMHTWALGSIVCDRSVSSNDGISLLLWFFLGSDRPFLIHRIVNE